MLNSVVIFSAKAQLATIKWHFKKIAPRNKRYSKPYWAKKLGQMSPKIQSRFLKPTDVPGRIRAQNDVTHHVLKEDCVWKQKLCALDFCQKEEDLRIIDWSLPIDWSCLSTATRNVGINKEVIMLPLSWRRMVLPIAFIIFHSKNIIPILFVFLIWGASIRQLSSYSSALDKNC